MRQAYSEGRDFRLEFQSGGGILLSKYSSNRFVEEGMTLVIPWDQIHSFFRGHHEAFATLIHSHNSQKELKLSLVDAITDDTYEALSNSVDELWSTFQLLKVKDVERNEWVWLPEAMASKADRSRLYFTSTGQIIQARFFEIKGAGVQLGEYPINKKNNPYGFESHALKFKPKVGDNAAIRNMIVGLSLLSFYLFLDQDHAAYINVGGDVSPHNFLTINARQSFPLDVVQSKAEKRVPISVFGNPKFSQFKDQLTPEALAEFGETWSGIFGPGDLGNFLEYDDVAKDEIVRFIWDLVKDQLLKKVNQILLDEELVDEDDKLSMAQFMQIIKDCGFDLTGDKLG